MIGISSLVAPPSAQAHLQAGTQAQTSGDLDRAAEEYLLAARLGSNVGLELAAQIREKQEKLGDAIRARSALVCAGLVWTDADWNRVEGWLREHNDAVNECAEASNEPLAVPWED